jgi:hypothetical protein
MQKQYLEFDAQAWWWPGQLPTEAKLLRLEVNSGDLDTLISKHQKNLIESTDVLRKLWVHCLQRGYTVTDKNNEAVADAAKKRLDALASERANVIGKIVFLFAPSEPKIQNALRGN